MALLRQVQFFAQYEYGSGSRLIAQKSFCGAKYLLQNYQRTRARIFNLLLGLCPSVMVTCEEIMTDGYLLKG